MNNLSLSIVYGAMGLLSATMLALSLKKKGRSSLDRNFQFVALMLLLWQAVLVLYYTVPDPQAALFWYDMNLPFVAFTALAWFLYIVRFYGLDSYFPKVVVVCLFVIPVFTLILCMTALEHNFLRTELALASMQPLRTVIM